MLMICKFSGNMFQIKIAYALQQSNMLKTDTQIDQQTDQSTLKETDVPGKIASDRHMVMKRQGHRQEASNSEGDQERSCAKRKVIRKTEKKRKYVNKAVLASQRFEHSEAHCFFC